MSGETGQDTNTTVIPFLKAPCDLMSYNLLRDTSSLKDPSVAGKNTKQLSFTEFLWEEMHDLAIWVKHGQAAHISCIG